MKVNIRNELLITALIMLILANIVNGGLSIFSFQKLYVDHLTSGYQSISKNLKISIEQTMDFGTPHEKSLIINEIIRDLKQKNPDLNTVSIALPDGKIIYSTDSEIIDKYLHDGLKIDFNSTEKMRKGRLSKPYIAIEGKYHIVMPLKDKTPKWLGTIDISFDDGVIKQKSNGIIFWNLRVLSIITLIAAVVMMVCLLIFFSDVKTIQLHKKRIYLILFLITGISQIVYFLYIVRYLQNIFMDMTPIKEIFLDLATVVLISFVFITEILVFFFIFLDKYSKSKSSKLVLAKEEQSSEVYSLIRPVSFIYQVGLALPFSFIPLYAEDLYKPILGLSKEFVMGLPVSMNMFCTTLAFLTAGAWMDRRGWQSLHFWGILLTLTASFLCGIAHGEVEFIIYRGLVGFGYGLTNLSYWGFVCANTTDKNRTAGFATINAGLFSGHLCGGTIGGMLADRIGFSPVFLVSFILMSPAIIFPFLFMRQSFQKKNELIQHADKDIKGSFRSTLHFIMNRNIFSLLLFLSIPASIVFTGLLYYLCPIYLDRLGISQANIARLLMINGLSMIYLSPLISPAIDRSPNKKSFLVSSGIIGSLGLLAFYYIEGLPAIILAIIMVSLSACLGNSSRPAYALQQKITLEFGGGKAMGIYRTVDRLGWVLGPFIFGAIIASKNTSIGLTIVGAVYLILTVLFIIVSEKEQMIKLQS